MNSLKRREGGYVTAMTALMLIPLMIMAALTVDVGAWYAEATSVQAAADAAALAGVPYMPKFDIATAMALEEAERNGYVDPDGVSQATFDNPTSYPQILVTRQGDAGLGVTIKTESSAYFGKVVLDAIVIERGARSEFIRPVAMGNPSAQLGGGHLLDPNDTSNAFWLNVQGYCGARANGARHYVGFENPAGFGCPTTPNGSRIRYGYNLNAAANPQFTLLGQQTYIENWWFGTTGLTPNDWYDGDGLRDDYFTLIELPQTANPVSYDVDIYRPGACAGVHEGGLGSTSHVYRKGTGANSNSLTNARIVTRLFNADTTLADRWDSIVPGNYVERLWSIDDCNGDTGDGWYTIGTIVSDADSRRVHYLSYGGREDVTEFWLNTFALRVVQSLDPTAAVCVDTATPSSCPTISAVDDMPIYISDVDEYNNSLFTDPANPAAPAKTVSFYLGNVAAEHAGKKLVIKLYDAGEGMQNLEIMMPSSNPSQPLGVAVPFTYYSDSCAQTGFCGAFGDISERSNDWCGDGTVPCLDVTNYRFQSNEVTIIIDLPSGYACGTDCWWRVRYDGGGGFVHDATEWSINIVGDPIRLTD